MIIDRLSVLNYKNIEEANLKFSTKINCFFGRNGMGKTNLLDAIYFLSFTKNYANLPDRELVKHGADFSVLQGFYCDGENEEEIYCGLKLRSRKVFRRNKKEYQRMSEHIGLIPLVFVSPADSSLLSGGSDERRKFVDMVICQYDKDYMQQLISYNKVLQQRNTLLKDSDRTPDDALLDILDSKMIDYGRVIHARRTEFTTNFIPIFLEYYNKICGNKETVDIQYNSQFNDLNNIDQLFATNRQRDLILGFSTTGIHKDDFTILTDGCLTRKIASQGQNKTCLIALKLAQYTHLVNQGSSRPLLLLDDIFDKLDEERVEQIVKLVASNDFGQIFITDTNRKYLDRILIGLDHDYRLFQVENGKIDAL